MCCLHSYTKQNKIFVQTFRCAVALWKSWVCKYSIRFQVIKLKLLCETLKNEKWKILAWYPNKMRRYRQRNPKCGDWRWTNFQMQVAYSNQGAEHLLLPHIKLFLKNKRGPEMNCLNFLHNFRRKIILLFFILSTDQVSLTDWHFCVRYWAVCLF